MALRRVGYHPSKAALVSKSQRPLGESPSSTIWGVFGMGVVGSAMEPCRRPDVTGPWDLVPDRETIRLRAG
jgi:hypothetical protein